MSSLWTFLSDSATDDEYDLSDSIDRYYSAFEEFAGNSTVGKFITVVTIDYRLPVGNEVLCETINLWTAPQTLSHPLRECYDTKVVPVIMDFMDRLDDSDLLGLSFRWSTQT